MLEGIKEDIVCLPVHDAVAVQQKHLKWVVKGLLARIDQILLTSRLLAKCTDSFNGKRLGE